MSEPEWRPLCEHIYGEECKYVTSCHKEIATLQALVRQLAGALETCKDELCDMLATEDWDNGDPDNDIGRAIIMEANQALITVPEELRK